MVSVGCQSAGSFSAQKDGPHQPPSTVQADRSVLADSVIHHTRLEEWNLLSSYWPAHAISASAASTFMYVTDTSAVHNIRQLDMLTSLDKVESKVLMSARSQPRAM